MTDDLTLADVELVLESLKYTRQAFQDYSGYPDYEFKQRRLAEVDAVAVKMRAIRDRLKPDPQSS